MYELSQEYATVAYGNGYLNFKFHSSGADGGDESKFILTIDYGGGIFKFAEPSSDVLELTARGEREGIAILGIARQIVELLEPKEWEK